MRHTRVIVTHYGGPDALRVVEEECPEPKDGEVRVRVLAAGVSLPDIMAREGVHPETPRVPFTPGWDLVGVVDRLGDGVSGIEPGQIVASMPIHGAYTEFVCLLQRELVPVPSGLDAAEAVSLVLNYITAYQMLHRSAKVRLQECRADPACRAVNQHALAWFDSGDTGAEPIHYANQIPPRREGHWRRFGMNALARHYVGQGDACGQHSHPHFTILRLGALFFNHPKFIGPAVVSNDDARVSHRPLPRLPGARACAA